MCTLTSEFSQDDILFSKLLYCARNQSSLEETNLFHWQTESQRQINKKDLRKDICFEFQGVTSMYVMARDNSITATTQPVTLGGVPSKTPATSSAAMLAPLALSTTYNKPHKEK